VIFPGHWIIYLTNISGGEHIRLAGLHGLVDKNATLHFQTGCLGQFDARPGADRNRHHLAGYRLAAGGADTADIAATPQDLSDLGIRMNANAFVLQRSSTKRDSTSSSRLDQ